MEYIKVPDYFRIKKIDCDLLKRFLNKIGYIEEDRIDINHLREFYSLDRERGLELIFELKLRGFQFKLNSPNHMLKSVDPKEEIELIYTKYDIGKIDKINKTIFGFVDSNKCKSDFYFNLVPIYTFKDIIKNFNYKLVKKEFIRYGYQVLGQKELSEVTKSKTFNNKIKENHESQPIKIPRLDFSQSLNTVLKTIINLNPEHDSKIRKLKIGQILPDRIGTEKAIKARLRIDNIDTIDDLINYNVNNLESIRGVGVGRIRQFKKHVVDGIKGMIDNSSKKTSTIGDYIKRITLKNEILKEICIDTSLRDVLPTETKTDEKIIKTIESEKIKSIYDLIRYNINDLKKIRGVGKQKISEIKTNINKKIKLIDWKYGSLDSEKFLLEEAEYELIKNYKIEEVNSIIYNNRFKLQKDIENKAIKELKNIRYKNLDSINTIIFLKDLSIDLGEILNINKILSQYINNELSEREKKIIIDRNIKERTLEEVGGELDLTRERIRQIEKKIVSEFNSFLKKNDFNKSLKLNFKHKEYLEMNDLKELIEKENYVVLGLIMNGYINGLYYYSLLDRVYYEPLDEKIKNLEYIIKDIPDYGDIEEDLVYILDLVSYIFKNISYDEAIKLLKEYDIKVHGTYYFRGKASRSLMVEIIFKYIHKKSLVIDKNGINLLSKYFNDLFNVKEENSIRNWTGVIVRTDNIILIGPRTYIHIDNIDIKPDVVSEIKKIIDNEFLNYNEISSEFLYEEINKRKPNNKIKNKYHVYSLVKYYYSEFFGTSSGNSLKIMEKGSPEITNSQSVYNICLENNGIIDTKTIKEITKWNNHSISMAIDNNPDLISIGPRKCAILDMIFQGKEKEIFENIVKEDMKVGYTTTSRIFHKLKFNDEMAQFISRNSIEDGKELQTLIKNIDDKIIGHNIFMSYQNQDINSLKDLIINRHKKNVNRSDIVEIVKELRINPGQLRFTIGELISEKEYIQISREEYFNYNKFKVDENIEQEIVKKFDSIYDDKGYIVPKNYISEIIRSYKKPEDFSWNQYTIAGILIKNGYKKLERFNTDYRYEILVLVKEENEYDDISYLIYNLLKNRYKGIFHESEVYDFLSELGIYKIESEENKKKLYLDAKQNDLIKVDIVGNIKLKE